MCVHGFGLYENVKEKQSELNIRFIKLHAEWENWTHWTMTMEMCHIWAWTHALHVGQTWWKDEQHQWKEDRDCAWHSMDKILDLPFSVEYKFGWNMFTESHSLSSVIIYAACKSHWVHRSVKLIFIHSYVYLVFCKSENTCVRRRRCRCPGRFP